jgi:CHASE3 domain sensor protein
MSKKSSGLFTFITGLAMGAAAVFLSKKQNREKTLDLVNKTKKQVLSATKQAKTQAKKELTKAQSLAKKTVKQVRKKVSEASAV